VRIALINQTFHPDVASTGQHLGDLALRLASRGHEVTVITSARAYDDPARRFAPRETWNGIQIRRVWASGLGKRAKWRRATDFATFMMSCAWNLARLPRPEVVVAMTSPPLISWLAAWYAKVRHCRFCYWIMDLNPDEALAAGWLSTGSIPARFLEHCSRFSLRQARRVIVLDRFMQERILAKGVDPATVAVVPPWSHDAEVSFDAPGREAFRSQHGLTGKFVVMYSGNHSPCHPLDTVLEAARALAGREDIAFCFIGGGSGFAGVQRFAAEHGLRNILCLPYQPLSKLSGTLSAADLHLVVMGNPFVGIVHPCKIYNILRVGSPFAYVGPRPSHVSDILEGTGVVDGFRVEHGDIAGLVAHIVSRAANRRDARPVPAEVSTAAGSFAAPMLSTQLAGILESTVLPGPIAAGLEKTGGQKLKEAG
jgi:colanic acid biosynthesis glycosyl transferase WcaI